MKEKVIEDITRIENMINNDRFNVSSDFEKLFSKDISELIGEYFILSSSPKIAIEKKGKNLVVSVVAVVNSVKAFSSVAEG